MKKKTKQHEELQSQIISLQAEHEDLKAVVNYNVDVANINFEVTDQALADVEATLQAMQEDIRTLTVVGHIFLEQFRLQNTQLDELLARVSPTLPVENEAEEFVDYIEAS